MSLQPIHLRNVPLFAAVPLSAGIVSSPPQNVEDVISYCVQYVWSVGSGISGSSYLEASNDYDPVSNPIGTWTLIQQSLLNITGATGNNMINVEKPAYSWVRLSFNISGGTATLNSKYNAKSQ